MVGSIEIHPLTEPVEWQGRGRNHYESPRTDQKRAQENVNAGERSH